MTITEVYQRACRSARFGRETQEGQESWVRVLGRHPVNAVCKALEEWQARTDSDEYTGRSVGAEMPTPADLLRIVERNSRLDTGDRQFRACGRGNCSSGFLLRPDPRTDGKAMIAYARCECWTEWAARVGGQA